MMDENTHASADKKAAKTLSNNPLLKDKISGHENVSLDVVALSYNVGKHAIKQVTDYIEENAPAAVARVLPNIKTYVSL